VNKAEKQLISRGLDGELTAGERARLEQLLAARPEARQTLDAWDRLGDQMRRDAATISVPDAAVAWVDIRRAIRQQEAAEPEGVYAPGLLGRLRWAGAVAALAVIGLLGWSAFRLWEKPGTPVAEWSPPANRVEWVVAGIPGATTMIYTDPETDMTVIWMDVAQEVDPRDT